MRRNWTKFLCLGLTIIFVTGLAPARSEQAKQITCTGKVVDAQDKPTADAKVTLYEIVRDETTYVYVLKLIRQTTTDANGAFSLAESLEGDNFPYGYIVAEKKGMILDFDNWRMRDGNKKIQIKQSQLKELAGIVVDENDKPVADAQVSISILKIVEGEQGRGLAGQVATKYFTLTTNSAGKFKFTGIPAEATAEFIVKKNGRATVNTYRRIEMAGQKLKFTPGQTDIKLVLPLEAKIEGIVVEKSSSIPVSGVKVRVMNQQDPPYFRPKPLVSKEDGTFSIGALASRRYTVELVPSREGLADWVAEPVEVITEAGKTKNDVKVELSKGGVLEVVFKDAVNKQSLEKVNVTIEHAIGGRSFSSRSNIDGVARMRLFPGRYLMNYIYKQGYSDQWSQDAFMIEKGKTERLEYELMGQPKITGVVRDEKGKPIEGVKLQVCPMGGREGATSDAEGRYEVTYNVGDWFDREAPVMFLICRYEEGNLAAAVQIYEDTRKIDIKLKPGVTFTGRVVDPNGDGIANALILFTLRRPSGNSVIGREQPTTDAQGKFEIKAVPPEQKYSLYTRAEGYNEYRSGEIGTNNAVDNQLNIGALTLALANLTVSGLVVDDDDKPVAGARISCYGDNQPSRRTQTDTEGKFTLENVCAGKIRLSANKSGTPRLYGSIETEGGATDVQIVISQRSSSTRYQPKRPPLLIGRPLPELKDVKIDLSPSDTEGKMILVCFFDMEQRPSRYCVNQLAKQAEQLKQKGIIVAAVQASKIDENTLNEWVKKYKIPFAVGMVQGDEEKTRFTWGVKSLPWLLLTDGKHIVRAEGFSINELNERIAILREK